MPAVFGTIRTSINGTQGRIESIFCVSQFYNFLSSGIENNGNGVKSDILFNVFELYIRSCCMADIPFLVGCNIFFRFFSSEMGSAGFYFHKSHSIVIGSYNIHFQSSYCPVPFKDFVPLLNKKIGCQIFTKLSYFVV